MEQEINDFQSEQSDYELTWKRFAAEGEITQAMSAYRSLKGGSVMAAKTAVENYRDGLPEEDRKITIELSASQAMHEIANVFPILHDNVSSEKSRILHKALRVLTRTVGEIARLRIVTTGPTPPNRRQAGFHWLAVYDCDGHYHGRQVMFWQPGAAAWCRSGMHASNADVDTEHWRYVAECPMPE